jgi:hypothetical protein
LVFAAGLKSKDCLLKDSERRCSPRCFALGRMQGELADALSC